MFPRGVAERVGHGLAGQFGLPEGLVAVLVDQAEVGAVDEPEHVAREVGRVVVDGAAALDAVGPVRAGVVGVLGPDGAGAVQLQEQVVAVPDVAGGRGVGRLPHAPAPAVVAEAHGAHAAGPDAVELAQWVPVQALVEAGLVLAREIAVVVVLEREAREAREPVARGEDCARVRAVAHLVVSVGLVAHGFQIPRIAFIAGVGIQVAHRLGL